MGWFKWLFDVDDKPDAHAQRCLNRARQGSDDWEMRYLEMQSQRDATTALLESANREIEELKADNDRWKRELSQTNDKMCRIVASRDESLKGLNGQLQEQRTLSLSRGAAMQSCLRKVEDAIELLREPGRTAFKDQFATSCVPTKSG